MLGFAVIGLFGALKSESHVACNFFVAFFSIGFLVFLPWLMLMTVSVTDGLLIMSCIAIFATYIFACHGRYYKCPRIWERQRSKDNLYSSGASGKEVEKPSRGCCG